MHVQLILQFSLFELPSNNQWLVLLGLMVDQSSLREQCKKQMVSLCYVYGTVLFQEITILHC